MNDQQFPLDIRSMAPLQRADLSDRDEFGALAPDEERHERDTSVMEPESGRQRELLMNDQANPLDIGSMTAKELKLEELSLEKGKKGGGLSKIEGEIVQIRGFWYPISSTEGMLAEQPNMKSCCLNSPKTIERRCVVKGLKLEQLLPQRVVTIEGKFQITPLYNNQGELIQLFLLDEAKETSKMTQSTHWILLGGLLMHLITSI